MRRVYLELSSNASESTSAREEIDDLHARVAGLTRHNSNLKEEVSRLKSMSLDLSKLAQKLQRSEAELKAKLSEAKEEGEEWKRKYEGALKNPV